MFDSRHHAHSLDSRLPPRAVHGRHLRHGRGGKAPAIAPTTPTGVTWDRGSRRLGPSRVHHRGLQPSRSIRRTRTTLRCPGSPSCGPRSPSSTISSTAAGSSRHTPRRRVYFGRGPGWEAHPRGRRAGADQPRPFPSRLHAAYEELLDIFKLFTAIPILLDGGGGSRFSVEDLRREVTGRGLSVVLLSNPCNPTGRVIQGSELKG